MKDAQIEQINREYEEYCSSQTKRNHALPFVIWLKYKRKIDPEQYCEVEK